MLTISKHIFILLSLTSLHPSNTFGGTVHENSSTELLLSAVQTLQNDMKSIKDDIKDVNLKIDRPSAGSFKGKLLRYIPLNIVLQESILLEPNMEVNTELDYNSLIDVRREEPNNSPLNQTSNQDIVIEHLKRIQQQQNNLTQQNLKLQILLNKTVNSKENNEIQSDSRKYDEHFNCIRNCSFESLPQSCSQATAANSSEDGVYLLKGPQTDSKPFYVYCTHEKRNEKGWMIIQRRENGSVNFNRNWLDYKFGFGDLNGEYWIGLERLHQITCNRPHELWISLLSVEGEKRYAKYSEFIILSEDEGYKLNLSGYSGDAGDSFEYHNSRQFSTFDKDNAICARTYKGGWWYGEYTKSYWNGFHDFGCFFSENDEYGIPRENEFHRYGLLAYANMAIRPREE